MLYVPLILFCSCAFFEVAALRNPFCYNYDHYDYDAVLATGRILDADLCINLVRTGNKTKVITEKKALQLKKAEGLGG